MKESFLLALRAFMRGRVALLLLVAVGLIHWLMPDFVRSDGTASGILEMHVRIVPGFAAAVILLTVLSTSCGMFARERELKRLSLTLVRPASAWGVVCGKWLATTVLAAAAIALSSVLVLAMPPTLPGQAGVPPCRHHYEPTLPPPAVVAGHILGGYLRDPETPEAVRKAPKRAVLALLTTKEMDRYDVVKPGETMVWPFDVPRLKSQMAEGAALALRVRFSTQFELRTPVAGILTLGDMSAVVSNSTQAVIEIPLARTGKGGGVPSPLNLTFANTGRSAVMIRPRRDLVVLAPADSFAWNLLRSQIEVWSLAAMLAAYGLFLSAALSRPVALFTALVSLAVVLMAPSVVAQFPDEFNASFADRFGLWLSRAVQSATHSVSAPSPITDLATGRAIEGAELLRTLAGNVLLLPGLLLSLAAFVVRRKPFADG